MKAWSRARRQGLVELGTCVSEAEARARVEAQLSGLRERLWATPAYREHLTSGGYSPRELRTLDDLRHFPLLSREQLAKRWEDFATGALEGAVVLWSSGTTGHAVRVLRDLHDQTYRYALLRYWASQLDVGLPQGPLRVLFLCTLPREVGYAAEGPLGDALVRVSTWSADPVERIEAFAPDVLSTDPAGLEWWWEHAPNASPALAMTSATPLKGGSREGSVVDVYALTEVGAVAWGCGAGAHHVLAPDVWVEAVEDEVVVTRLRAGAMTLLRYRTGDRCDSVSWGRCDCGVRGWQIHGLRGRVAVGFVTPAGAVVNAWRVAWVFRGVGPFRWIQISPERMVIETSDGQPREVVEARLRGALALLGWETVELQWRRCSHVTRDAWIGVLGDCPHGQCGAVSG